MEAAGLAVLAERWWYHDGEQWVPAVIQEAGPERVTAAVEQRSDLVEGEPELPVEEDLLEPRELGFAVLATAGGAPDGGREEPDLVVVVQRADRDPGHPRHVSDPVRHPSPISRLHLTLRDV